MPLSFITLCNAVLRRMNEVEIPEVDFPSVRGVQAKVKDAVRYSINHINQQQFEWPFNAATHQMDLVPGTVEYDFPAGTKTVEWVSFRILPDVGNTYKTKRLHFIHRDEYERKYRDEDVNAGASGAGIPERVYDIHEHGFGVTPSPDKAYRISFRYFQKSVNLSAASDVTRIPDDFEHVIVEGAMYYMYLFKNNMESAQLTFDLFDREIGALRTIYINSEDRVIDRRVKF